MPIEPSGRRNRRVDERDAGAPCNATTDPDRERKAAEGIWPELDERMARVRRLLEDIARRQQEHG
jgi:hypothetical protein